MSDRPGLLLRLACTVLFAAALLPLPALAAGLANQLQSHPSPYLALHGEDPVAWQAWDQAVFTRAREENRLVFVSVGYFSCHWCHVMQRESYRDREIAALLNRDYLPVKVDRELQPALDSALMNFVQQTQGRGGWPLNVFITPEGYPLYAVLYRPPAQFQQLLEKLTALWREDSGRLVALARAEVAAGFADSADSVDPGAVAMLGEAFEQMALGLADTVQGGFGGQSRFPHVPQLEYLLERYQRHAEAPVREVLVTTLDAMARRGLHDHLGGGFFRYTVDPGWEQPHFEKMLYTNAQLARLYLRAGDILSRPDYTAVARSTLDFLVGRMRTGSGAMVAAFSAVDAAGREGGYYLWPEVALRELLSDEHYQVLSATWALGPAAFEHGHLLVEALPIGEVATLLELEPGRATELLAEAMAQLRVTQRKRSLPVDDKLLAGWNGLALAAFAEAARETGESGYTEVAQGLRDYLAEVLWNGRVLVRALAAGAALGTVSLEDYAYVAEGLLAFAELTGREADFELAAQVARAGWETFRVGNGWRLGTASLLANTPLHEMVADSSLPAADAVLSRVSLRLSRQLGAPVLAANALGALARAYPAVTAAAFSYASRIRALETALD